MFYSPFAFCAPIQADQVQVLLLIHIVWVEFRTRSQGEGVDICASNWESDDCRFAAEPACKF